MKVAIPTIDEQAEIVCQLKNKISTLNSLIDKACYGIDLLMERRTALISAAVTGKIDVRSWQSPKSLFNHQDVNKEAAA
jgi:type I restriction enzyme S subunit